MAKKELLLDAGLIRQLEQLELVVRRLYAGRTAGEKRSRRRGVGSEFADYREYAQGDDLRRVDWNVYGRLDRLFLKLFHEEEDLRLSVFIDRSLSMSHGEPPKLQYAKKLAAALGYVALANLDRVTIEAASGVGLERLEPVRGKAQLWRMLEFLDDLEAAGTTELYEGIKEFALRNAWPGMKVVISDFLDKAGAAEALKWLVRGEDQVVILQVLSPEEMNPSFVGDLALLDCEDASLTEVSITPALLRKYQSNLRTLVGMLKDFCRTRGLAYFLAPTAQPVEQVILTAMRRTGVLR